MASYVALIAAYLLGSPPSALLFARAVAGVDIRTIGDGNMGARNVAHMLGWGPAIAVAVAGFCKGALCVLLAEAMGLPTEWQMLAGAFVVLGPVFPIFAVLRGGQGFAATIGVMFALMPVETAAVLVLFGLANLATHRFSLSAGVCMAELPALGATAGFPTIALAYIAALFLSVLAKTALDLPRRRQIDRQRARPA